MLDPSARPWSRSLAAGGAILVALPQQVHSQSSCCAGGPLSPQNCNVAWNTTDSVTACPAGDSVYYARPSRLYIFVHYEDNNCNPRVGVPPESVWVTYQTTAGNLVLNDMGPKVFADDSTNTNGDTRIILRSFSGCGTIRVHLFVSGKGSGFNDRLVRTVDPDGNGRFEPTEGAPTCDLNYNGVANLVDRSIAFPHFTDWHRNAMFGTLVRRTSLCETCSPESTGTIGDSEVFWSPDGKQIALTIHVGPADATKTAACRIFLMRSDPLQGNALTQFTFSPVPDTIAVHDYDPSWSPLGNVIAFDRYDRRILRKGIPGVSPDTSTYLVSASGDQFNSGDATPAISPDGQWVAFSRRDAGPRHLYKVPISGGTATQLTSESDGVDFYPQWSPSGVWITFDRQSGASDQPHHAYKVKYNGDSLQVVYNAPSGQDAATPTFSPDSAIVLFGQGTHDTGSNPPRDVTTRTFDPLQQSTIHPVANYIDTSFAVKGPDPVLSPRLSPDGTRLALRSKQIWAARRNMSLPPQFTNIGSHAVADSTPVVSDSPYVGDSLNFTVSATDPESDPLTYQTFFLQAGMTFDPSTRTFAWRVPGPAGATYYLKFMVTTRSGGTDGVLDKFAVQACCAPHGPAASGAIALERIEGPNPTTGHFAVSTEYQPGATARLSIFDVAGRRVALVRAPAGKRLVWDGNGASGSRAPVGVYLYRIEVGTARREGRVVVMR